MFGKGRVAQSACQRSVAAAGRSASDTSRSRPCANGVPSTSTSSREIPMRGAAAPPSQTADARPRARCLYRPADAAFDHVPRRIIEVGIEPRQHHGAMGQAGDGGDQPGGRRHRAGGAGGDHRPIALFGEPFRLGGDQPVAARRRFDPAALGEHGGPILARDLEEPQRQLPVRVERVRHQFVEPVPRHLPGRHVVDQPRQVVGKRESGGGRVGDQRRARCGAYVRLGRPFAHQFGEQHAPLQAAKALGQCERVGGKLAAAMLANAISSSSRSPSATMRGRIAASLLSRSMKLSRTSRQARWVGR